LLHCTMRNVPCPCDASVFGHWNVLELVVIKHAAGNGVGLGSVPLLLWKLSAASASALVITMWGTEGDPSASDFAMPCTST
jgi:hypothetical protein